MPAQDINLGKMRPSWDSRRDHGWYRCLARDRGYYPCEQPLIGVELVDNQVIHALSNLTIPDGFKKRVEEAVRNRVENAEAEERMKEIKKMVERIDFSWEHGYLSPEKYSEKRNQLEKEIASLRPIEYDDLMEAADFLKNFDLYFEECKSVEDPDEARMQLLAKIVDRVFVWNDRVIAITLHGDFGVVLNDDELAPHEIVEKIKTKMGASDSENPCAQNGNDGDRPLTCIILVVFFLPKHITKQFLLTDIPTPINEQLGKSYYLSI